MMQEQKVHALIQYFSQQPEVKTELHYDTPFQLLVAVVLSAQCTDKRVNSITPALFKAFPTPLAFARSSFEEVFPYIKSISYPNNKTKYLIQTSQQLVANFAGELPADVHDLYQLPGVGRKSAHVISAVLYDTPTLAVDTHVMRVAKRLGLVDRDAKNPLAIEKQLVNLFPQQHIASLNTGLVIHGRYTCLARKPKCDICPLIAHCVYFRSPQNTYRMI
jgi:endonuclease-3